LAGRRCVDGEEVETMVGLPREDFVICLGADELAAFRSGQVEPNFGEEVRQELEDLGVRPEQVALQPGSAGYGADALTILATIAGVFLAGKAIEDSIEAWPKIGLRLRRVLAKLRDKHGSATVSEPGALALALQEMHDRGLPTVGVKLLNSLVLPVFNGTIDAALLEHFRHQPDRFYLFTFRTAESDVVIVCLRSSGEVEFIRRLPAGNYMEYYGVIQKGDK
jgi:hypothetical protein